MLTPKQARVYYVYTLADPRDGQVFYVGKGTGRRAQSHARRARRGGHNATLDARILDLQRDGLTPVVTVVADNLSEVAAFALEREEITAGANLCNISPGVISPRERHRAWARRFFRTVKPLREYRNLRPESRALYLRMLREVATIFARPMCIGFDVIDGRAVPVFE